MDQGFRYKSMIVCSIFFLPTIDAQTVWTANSIDNLADNVITA